MEKLSAIKGLSAAVAAFALSTFNATAGELRFRTEVGFAANRADATSLATAEGYSDTQNTNLGLRAMWDHSEGPFRFELHGIMARSHGSATELGFALAPYFPPPAIATYFDWADVSVPDARTVRVLDIDRASVGFSTGNLVIKVGRQAITWGGGMVFHASDIVAPFSPSAVDTSYKPGADMIYVQYLFDSGADIQAIALPRPATIGGPVVAAESTYAVLVSGTVGMIDGRLLAARDRGDNVVALGLSGPLGGASWNAEYVDWRPTDGPVDPSWLFNISTFGTLGNWNVSYFAEAFHNGFGVDASVPLDVLPDSLNKRLSTGQVFYAGQNFLAFGAQIQMTPDLGVAPMIISSLDDDSALASLSANYSLGDNTDLSFSLFAPVGDDGTEFGGRETSAGSGEFFGPQKSVGLRLVHFF
jgi:hypothetical protein